MQCAGWAAVGRPWRVGVVNPLRRDELITTVSGAGIAVATSGSAERGSHVVDPHTGRAPHALASITLVGGRLSEVDALATAAFAAGEHADEVLASLPGIEAFAVRADGSTWKTGGWPA